MERGSTKKSITFNDLKLYGNSKKEAERLTNTVRIFSKNLAMKIGISKCAPVKMKVGKLVILEANDTMHIEMKDKIQKEHYRRIRQLTSSKLNGEYTIGAINYSAVSLVRYSAGILKWTKNELKVMDSKIQKIITVNRRYHSRSDIDRRYNARMEGGKVLLSIIDCVEQNISRHLEHLEGRLLRFSKSEMILPQYGGPLSTAKAQKREKRHKQWKEKQTQRWIKKGFLKKETEGLMFAGQVKALRMNWKRKNIDDQQVSEKCRICEEIDESITHLFAECKKLVQKEYKQRNDNVARIVHLELCRKFGLVGKVKWYNGLK